MSREKVVGSGETGVRTSYCDAWPRIKICHRGRRVFFFLRDAAVERGMRRFAGPAILAICNDSRVSESSRTLVVCIANL